MVQRFRIAALGGIELDAVTIKQAADRCENAVRHQRRGFTVGVYNAAKVVAVQSDSALAQAIHACDLIIADGQALVWAARWLHYPISERVTGIDLFEELLKRADAASHSVFFLGAEKEVLEKLAERLHRDFPHVLIAGMQDGYYSAQEEAQIADQIRDSHADYLFVALPSPRKEFFIQKWKEQMDLPVCHGVGGSFDVLAGKVRRAPKLLQKMGLEWFFRLLQEPLRLGPRYWQSNWTFIKMVLKAKWRQTQ